MGSKIVIEWGQSILALLGRHKFPLSNGLCSHNAKYRFEYSLTSPYGHLSITDSSFGPRVPKITHSLPL